MKSPLLLVSIAALSLTINTPGLASPVTCEQEGVNPQRVLLTYGGEFIDHWDVIGAEPHEIELPSGFHLGVAISPAPREIYLRWGEWAGEFMEEHVMIQLFDMSSSPPELLTYTYGGSNSLQGYGPRGGADTVKEVGPKDVELFLQRPVCVRVADVASGDIAGMEK